MRKHPGSGRSQRRPRLSSNLRSISARCTPAQTAGAVCPREASRRSRAADVLAGPVPMGCSRSRPKDQLGVALRAGAPRSVQQAGDAAVDPSAPLRTGLGAAARRLGDPREDLEQGGFTCMPGCAGYGCRLCAGASVLAPLRPMTPCHRRCKCPDDLALLDLEGDILERPEIFRTFQRSNVRTFKRSDDRVAQRVMALRPLRIPGADWARPRWRAPSLHSGQALGATAG